MTRSDDPERYSRYDSAVCLLHFLYILVPGLFDHYHCLRRQRFALEEDDWSKVYVFACIAHEAPIVLRRDSSLRCVRLC